MSKCWYCNNELTTGDNPKHFGICNKCYDEMFKSSDTIIRSFTNKIADLEAKLAEKETEIGFLEGTINSMQEDISYWEQKLAEKEKAVDGLQEINQSLGQTCNNDAKEIERLRELISDKEKEKDKLTAKLEQANEIINNPDTLIFQQQELIDNLQIIIKEKEKEIENYKHLNVTIGTMENNQVDISSTTYIDQDKISFSIEQLEKVKENIKKVTITDFDLSGNFEKMYKQDAIRQIDNQIKQLKEGN